MLGILAAGLMGFAEPEDRAACSQSRETIEACEAQSRSRLLADIGLEPIEALQREGFVVRRALFFDHRRRPMPVVEFRHAPGQPPMVTAVFDRFDRGEPVRLDAIVPLKTWQEMLADGEYFDRALAPEAATAQIDEEGNVLVTLCIHSRLAWVQAADEDDGIRETGGTTCDDSLAVRYAYKLVNRAAELIPQCAMLDAETYGAGPERLAACFELSGDTLTAAHLANAMANEPLLNLPRDMTVADARRLMVWDGDFSVDWAGERITARDAAAAFLVQKFVQERADIYEMTHEGEAWNRVRSRGVVQLFNPYDDCPYEPDRVAPIDIVWVRSDDLWRIRSLTVGAFVAHPVEGEC